MAIVRVSLIHAVTYPFGFPPAPFGFSGSVPFRGGSGGDQSDLSARSERREGVPVVQSVTKPQGSNLSGFFLLFFLLEFL